MDALDVRILRTMGIYPFLTWPHPPASLKPTFIARKVGRSVEAVKERIARLEAQRVITGYEVFPNFRHFDMKVMGFHFRVRDPAHKTRAVQQVGALEGVMSSWNFQGPTVCFELGYRSPEELDAKLSGLAGALQADLVPYACFQYAMPPVARRLRHLDWRILAALRGDARRSLDDVARGLRVSGRTVRRRFDQMAREGSLDVVAMLDPARITGHVLCEANVAFAVGAPADPRRILRLCEDTCYGQWTVPDPGHPGMTLMLLLGSLAEAEDLRLAMERVPGVQSAEMLVPAGNNRPLRWIDEEIARRAAATAPRRSAAPPPA